MRRWLSLTTVLGLRRRNTAEGHLRLTEAYRAVFTGVPGKEDQTIVLADLAARSGAHGFMPSTYSAEALRHQEGMRELYSHISRHLTLAPEDLHALENAARIEMNAEQ